jgi:lipoprotein signal peptidase
MRKNKKLLKKIKPKKSVYIFYTFIFLGPLGNLLIDVIDHNTKQIGVTIVLTVISTPFVFYYWHEYKQKKISYEMIKDHFQHDED